MWRWTAYILTGLAIAIIPCTASYGEPVNAATIVEEYYNATDLQRAGMLERHKNDALAASGIVEDVKEDETFDVTNDIRRRYYKVITEVQKGPQEKQYRVILIYKNIADVKNIVKGQKIAVEGRLLRLVDEGLYLSIWLSEENLSPEEAALFK